MDINKLYPGKKKPHVSQDKGYLWIMDDNLKLYHKYYDFIWPTFAIFLDINLEQEYEQGELISLSFYFSGSQTACVNFCRQLLKIS